MPKSNSEAAKWYRMAANQEVQASQIELAKLYAAGEGVVQNIITASMWRIIAIENGSIASAVSNLDDMSAAEGAEADRRARVCMASNYQDCD